MALEQWAVPQLSQILSLDAESLQQVIRYTETLSDAEAAGHLRNLLGDSPQALDFITAYGERRLAQTTMDTKHPSDAKHSRDNGADKDVSQAVGSKTADPPGYAPPAYPPPSQRASKALRRPHTNLVIEAAHARAKDEVRDTLAPSHSSMLAVDKVLTSLKQEMQNRLQSLQMQYQIYNSEIEPEHDTDYYCNCPIHNYKNLKYRRLPVQNMWSKAVMYPGEKAYNDSYQNMSVFGGNNPYRFRVMSPYGNAATMWAAQRPRAGAHALSIHQTISLNNSLNHQAQVSVDSKEPKVNIWSDESLDMAMARMSVSTTGDKKGSIVKPSDEKRRSLAATPENGGTEKSAKSSKLTSFRKAIGIKSEEEKVVAKTQKNVAYGVELKEAILKEEDGRWPDDQWRQIVNAYQEKVGMTRKIADLRARQPLQYLHLLRAGYFEPIPVAWAGQASNPLKFSIEAAGGWRGITPTWRGYEDTAEERLYWVLNHREGIAGVRMKPDFISAMDMARARMASAVEPPPEYYSVNDTCHVQHTSSGYSKQVMPTPFRAYDRPELPTDDTMILLDVSGSMDFDPIRPNYDQYLITGYSRSTQPKNKDVAKAIIRRFTDAMANHDHQFQGYSLVTFSSQASHIGTVNHQNLEAMWRNVRLGGGTRVMTGWQRVKDLHFQKHSESATHHPVYGWQAGPQTPMLRLLLLLDGEATDMDEFELDLLGLSWAHVTIFLIGVDGCPHHHRHANELQRISDVNHHVSFVDAQGNTPERFVTHELLKRHLGYDISMAEFEQMEELPGYTE